MSKESAPAFLFYAADYLADAKVQIMTIEEEGCYCRLMAYCWREGSIPKDPDLLKRLCKGVEPSNLVQGCFKQSRTNSARLVHKRLEIERKKKRVWREKSKLGGQRSAHKRKNIKGISNEQGGSRVVEPKGNISISNRITNKRYTDVAIASENEVANVDRTALEKAAKAKAATIKDIF
jgi:uncharacterized protein YdaU (DUF1376 family)